MFESLGVWLLIFWLVECVPSWKTNSFRYCTRFHFEAGSTLPKTNIGPENRAYQKDISSSNHHFAGAIVVSRIVVCHHTSWEFGGKLRNSADVLLTFLFGRYAGAMNYLVPRAVCFSVTSVQTNQGLTMVCSNIDVDVYICIYIVYYLSGWFCKISVINPQLSWRQVWKQACGRLRCQMTDSGSRWAESSFRKLRTISYYYCYYSCCYYY